MLALPFLLSLASAQIYIGFPMNEQLPNVARSNSDYSFQLAEDTYKSWSSGQISYSASNLPSWLSFDASSRTFTGTPATSNVGSFDITLSGIDSSDSTVLSNNYSMIVSSDAGLHLSANDSMFVEIAKYGQTNGLDGLVLKQGDSFDIKFDTSIFTSDANSTRPIVAYYGLSSDRSSLPNWISFSNDSLSFSGTVPYVTSSVAPSFEYSFSFIGTDYIGYAGAEGLFKILVGAHQLSTSVNETIKVNGTYGTDFDVQLPIFSQIYLDGTIISSKNISSISANGLPSYISLSDSNYTLSGTFPNSSSHENFTVTVTDAFENSVDIPYSFDSIGSVFTLDTLPEVNATAGEYFQYQLLNSWFTDVNNTNVTVSYDASWLTYHTSNRTLNGVVPSDVNDVSVRVSASSSYDDESKSLEIKSVGKSVTTTSTTSSSSSTSSASSSSSSSSSSSPVAHSSSKKNLAIGLGVGIPVGLGLLGLILFCCFRRRKAQNDEDDFSNKKIIHHDELPEKSQVSISTKTESPAGSAAAAAALASAAAAAAATSAKNDFDDDYDSQDEHFDIRSTSSTITHVESNPKYLDAVEKPMKSWRANDASDAKEQAKRESEISLSTVNTEQLFSVRLVNDEKSYRNSSHSDSLNSRQFLSSNSLSAVLTRSSSGNIQRLDSYGNLVDVLHDPRSNLDVVDEEHSRDYSRNTTPTVHQEGIGAFESYKFNEETDTSSYNLLSKFNESRNPSQSNSERDFSNYDLKGQNEDYFLATKDETGEFKWAETSSNLNLSNSTANGQELITPSSEHFSQNETPVTLHGSPMQQQNHSAISVGSIGSLGPKAKLMNFTRKGSLRESVHEHDFRFGGVSATIVRNENENENDI